MESTIETKVCRECGMEHPITMFKLTQGGRRSSVCTPCVTRKLKETYRKKREARHLTAEEALEKARRQRIEEFTARELMEELARRGYKGKLEYTETHVIDIENF